MRVGKLVCGQVTGNKEIVNAGLRSGFQVFMLSPTYSSQSTPQSEECGHSLVHDQASDLISCQVCYCMSLHY